MAALMLISPPEGLWKVALPGFTFIASGGVVLLLVVLDLLTERLIFLPELFRIALLLFKNRRGFGGLVALVDRGAGDGCQHRKDRNQQLRVEKFQHGSPVTANTSAKSCFHSLHSYRSWRVAVERTRRYSGRSRQHCDVPYW